MAGLVILPWQGRWLAVGQTEGGAALDGVTPLHHFVVPLLLQKRLESKACIWFRQHTPSNPSNVGNLLIYPVRWTSPLAPLAPPPPRHPARTTAAHMAHPCRATMTHI